MKNEKYIPWSEVQRLLGNMPFARVQALVKKGDILTVKLPGYSRVKFYDRASVMKIRASLIELGVLDEDKEEEDESTQAKKKVA